MKYFSAEKAASEIYIRDKLTEGLFLTIFGGKNVTKIGKNLYHLDAGYHIFSSIYYRTRDEN